MISPPAIETSVSFTSPVARKNRFRAGSPGQKIRAPGLKRLTDPVKRDRSRLARGDGFAGDATSVGRCADSDPAVVRENSEPSASKRFISNGSFRFEMNSGVPRTSRSDLPAMAKQAWRSDAVTGLSADTRFCEPSERERPDRHRCVPHRDVKVVPGGQQVDGDTNEPDCGHIPTQPGVARKNGSADQHFDDADRVHEGRRAERQHLCDDGTEIAGPIREQVEELVEAGQECSGAEPYAQGPPGCCQTFDIHDCLLPMRVADAGKGDMRRVCNETGGGAL